MNKIFKELDEYKSYIVTLGIILGGYLQVVGLWGVGLEYVRFFSSTQILSDGVLGVILMIFFFGIFEICNEYKWSALTTFVLTIIFSIIVNQYHYYSIAIFLSYGTANIFVYFIYSLFNKLVNIQSIKKVPFHIPKGVILGFGLTIFLILFGYCSTYIGSTPVTFYLNDKIKSEMEGLGTGTKLQYFNDKYIFLVNDSDRLRKVKVLKTDDYLLKY